MANVPFQTIYWPENPEIANAINQNFALLQVDNTGIQIGTVLASNLSSVIKDTDSRIVYSGATDWKLQTAGGSAPAGYLGGYNNQYHTSTTIGAYFQYSAITSGFNLYCIVGPDCGKINVVIDGGSPTTIDLYAASYAVSNVFSTTLQQTQHTLVATIQNTKNASSSNYRCNLVCITDGTQLTDVNMLVGALNDISIGNINANKLTAGSTIFNVSLSNGSGTFVVDGVTGNLTCNNATMTGNLTVNGTLIVPNQHTGIQFTNVGGVDSSYQAKIYTDSGSNFIVSSGSNTTGVKIFAGPYGVTAPAQQVSSFSFDLNGYPLFSMAQGLWVSTDASSNGIFNVGIGSGFKWYTKNTNTMTLDSSGNWSVIGTKSGIIETSDGKKKVYAVESPEVWLEDIGDALVGNGSAKVYIDLLFLDMLEGDYQVFITPYDRCKEIWVERHKYYFIIHADNDCSVGWRMIGHRKGFADTRMEHVK